MTSHRMTQYDWLDDLCVRFLINLPKADMMDMQRLCFQAEEAHWFYDDFVRPNDKSMPRMSLREFCLALFKQCPLLCDHPDEQLASAFDDFMKYKPTVPVRGAILLNDKMDEVLLVKGWKKSAHWGFPKGKINLNEDDLDCAIREVDEETGFDIRAAGLVPPRDEAMSITLASREQETRLFIFRGVSKNTVFEAKTRKEISDIQWFRIADLPSNKKKPHHHGHETDDPGNNQMSSSRFYLVGPFMNPLRRKIREIRARDTALATHGNRVPPPPQLDEAVEGFTEDEGAQPPPEYYGYQENNSGYPCEPQQQQPQQQQQQYADASRDLLSIISRPSPAASQPQTAPMPYADQNAPTASALMAMLQKGGSQANAQANQPAGHTPHTPVDHVYGQVPQPNTPHHPHFTNQQGQSGPQDPFYQHQAPPPPFSQQGYSVPQSMPQFMQGQGLPQSSYEPGGAAQPDLVQYQYEQQQQLRRQQEYEQQQQQVYMQQQQAQQQQHHAQQQAQQTQQQKQQTDLLALLTQNGSSSAAAPPPPPHASAYQQGVQQTQKAPTPTILHPQPLPPTVQKALFARDSLASPDVSAYTGGQGLLNMMMPPPPPPPQQPQQQTQPQQQQAPLNSHAANLLSFFKADPPPPVQQPQPQPELQQPEQTSPVQPFQQQLPAHILKPVQQTQQKQSPVAVFSEAHHPNGPRAPHSGRLHHYYGTQFMEDERQPNSNSSPKYYGTHFVGSKQQFSGQGVPDTLNKIINGNNSITVKPSSSNGSNSRPASGSNPFMPHPPQSQHASSLLSMFKQTTAAPAPGPEAAAAPMPATVYPTPTATTTTAVVNDNNSHANGSASAAEASSEVNLPFGALSLLSRAKANESSQHPSTFAVPIVELPAGTATTTPTTILQKQPSFPHQVTSTGTSISGRPIVDSPDHGRPSTHGSGHQYYPPPPDMQQQQQQHVGVRRPSYTSSSSVAAADGAAGYPTTAQQLLQQFQKSQPPAPPSRQPSLAGSHSGQQQPPLPPPQQQQQTADQQKKLLSLFGNAPLSVQPHPSQSQGQSQGQGQGQGQSQGQGLTLQQSMQQNLLQQFQRQTGHQQAPLGSQMSPTAFAGPGGVHASAHMPAPGSVSSRGSMDQRGGAVSGLGPPGSGSGAVSSIASPENDSGVDALSGLRRGGSQPPISTEKRDFLLSYLTSRT